MCEVIRHIEIAIASIRVDLLHSIPQRRHGVKMRILRRGLGRNIRRLPLIRAFRAGLSRGDGEEDRGAHLYDCNRANKAMAALGVEACVLFLDPEFLDPGRRWTEFMRLRQGRMEKAVLREGRSRATCHRASWWRQKEQFSDEYNRIDLLKAEAGFIVSDADLRQEAPERFPINPPTTKERGYRQQQRNVSGGLLCSHGARVFDRSLHQARLSRGTPPFATPPTSGALGWMYESARCTAGETPDGVHQRSH